MTDCRRSIPAIPSRPVTFKIGVSISVLNLVPYHQSSRDVVPLGILARTKSVRILWMRLYNFIHGRDDEGLPIITKLDCCIPRIVNAKLTLWGKQPRDSF